MKWLKENDRRKKAVRYFLLYFLFLLYSFVNVISKKIAVYSFWSMEYFGGLALIFLCLGIYAIGWQQILKHFSLSRAFANKACVVIWGLIWGKLIFNEEITPAKIIGALLIITGIILLASEESGDEKC